MKHEHRLFRTLYVGSVAEFIVKLIRFIAMHQITLYLN